MRHINNPFLPPVATAVYNPGIDITKWRPDMPQVTLSINGADHTLDVPEDMPLLWALRDKLNMTGTKYSCGIGQCGTCTVLVDGEPVKSCRRLAVSMVGREITTIEGL